MDLNEKDLDCQYAIGFLKQWAAELKDDSKSHITEQVKAIDEGIKQYLDRIKSLEQDYQDTLSRYNSLTALSAGYLQHISQQKEQIGQLLIQEQQPFHKPEIPEIDI